MTDNRVNVWLKLHKSFKAKALSKDSAGEVQDGDPWVDGGAQFCFECPRNEKL
jgi:hypothetical protein